MLSDKISARPSGVVYCFDKQIFKDFSAASFIRYKRRLAGPLQNHLQRKATKRERKPDYPT